MAKDGLESYVVELGGEVCRFLMSKGASLHDAQDCVQNTFYKLLLSMDSLTEESIRPWFYRVSLNDYIDLQRKLKPLNFEPNQDSPVTSGGLESLLLKEEILAVLSDVKEEYGELLLLKYYYEFTYEEIAKLLLIKPTSVKQKLARARASIKKESGKSRWKNR